MPAQEDDYVALSPISPTTSSLRPHDHDNEPEPRVLAPLKIDDSDVSEKPPTPLPRLQFAVLLLLLLTEPVGGFIIYPFIAQLVGELDITGGDEKLIGYYAGIVESLFYVAQGLTVLAWGRLSDKIGRRPVILIGTLGLSFSLLVFGYSKTFFGVVLGRSLAGFLDGNVGVAKTILAELSDDTNRARAFSVFPVAWITGATFAPLVGGALEHPAKRFPALFGSEYWVKYPYLLPCMAGTIFCLIGFAVGTAFLEETLKSSPKNDHAQYESLAQEPGTADDDDIEDFVPPTSSSPSSPTSPAPVPSIRVVLVRPVIYAILNYAALALLDIAFFALNTIFFAVPPSAGGLGFSPPTIGLIFAFLGVASGLVQLFVFPKAHKRWGSKRILRASLAAFLIIFPLYPLMHLAALRWGPKSGFVWTGVLIMVLTGPLVDMGYSCSFMYVTTSSPDPALLGSVNGLAQTFISSVRAVGPAGTTALFSLSTNRQWMGGSAIYWGCCIVTVAAMGMTLLLPESELASEREKTRKRNA